MPSLIDRVGDIWNGFKQSPTQVPSYVPIPQERVDKRDNLGANLRANEQYFEIRINEIFLSYQREWFTTYDPMVLAVTEFSYAGQKTVAPLVVGPAMVEKFGSEVQNGKAPQGMMFANSRVAGPIPYRGGDINVTVILYRTQRQNLARELLTFVESSATVLDLVVPVGTYVKMAGLVMDGVETLTGTDGLVDPLIGRRDEFKPVEPGYFVLTNTPKASLDDLWVRDKQLVRGPSLEEATPFRDTAPGADYVLYSVTTAQRDDVSTLPFFPTWQIVLQEAVKSSKKDIWDSAQMNMVSLRAMLYTSPDLTTNQALQLDAEWTQMMNDLHEQAKGQAKRGPARRAAPPSELDDIRDRILSGLDL